MNILKLYFRKWKIQDQLLLHAQSGLRIESIQDRWRRFMLIILARLITQLPILIECVKISNTKMAGTSSIGVSITSSSCQIFPTFRIFTPSGLIVPVYSTNSNINPYSSITCQNVSLSHVKCHTVKMSELPDKMSVFEFEICINKKSFFKTIHAFTIQEAFKICDALYPNADDINLI